MKLQGNLNFQACKGAKHESHTKSTMVGVKEPALCVGRSGRS